MKHKEVKDNFSKGLRFKVVAERTPSEEYKTPVIGKITTKRHTASWTNNLTGEVTEVTYEPETFEVIAEEEFFYICNQWNEPGVPQLVPKDFVETFEEY